VHVLICATDQAGMVAGLAAARRIRAAGLSVESYLDDAPLKKQLRYANLKQIPLVVLMPRVGDDEERVILKDMNAGRQEQVETAGLDSYVSEFFISEIGGTK
jgi:histidyl-tRNA synthetase